MHTALNYITGFLLLAALIAMFRPSLIAFIAVMVLMWWADGHYTDPAGLETFHGAQMTVAKTVEGYTLAFTKVVGAVEHFAESHGYPIAHPAT